MINRKQFKKYTVKIVFILLLAVGVFNFNDFAIYVQEASHIRWWSTSLVYFFGKDLRVSMDTNEEIYPRKGLGDFGVDRGRLDFDVYAYTGDKGKFYTYTDDVLYTYGSSGYFVIYAEPFKIKFIRSKHFNNLTARQQKIINKALSQYGSELEILTSLDDLTEIERAACMKLHEKAKLKQEE